MLNCLSGVVSRAFRQLDFFGLESLKMGILVVRRVRMSKLAVRRLDMSRLVFW